MKDFAQQKKDLKKNKSVSNITTGKSPVPIKLILALSKISKMKIYTLN
jgi:hypothetical protein